eukprot:11223413-Lingulodinium_polyedra.AAC.1
MVAQEQVDVQNGSVARVNTGDAQNSSSNCTPAPDTGSSHVNPDGPRQPSQYCALRGRGGGRTHGRSTASQNLTEPPQYCAQR